MKRLLLLALMIAAPTAASETISYSYDARGRLVKVQRAGTVNDGISACYIYDKADNRSNVTVLNGSCNVSVAPPVFSINDVSVTEGGSLVFTVTKTGATASSYGVNFATANSSASAGSDYQSSSGSLTFAPSETSKTITVQTVDNAILEPTETMLVNLSGATDGASISDGQGVGTIHDNDTALVSFSINDKSAIEGTTMTFTVTKTGTSSATTTVSYATADGTAQSTAPIDYQPASGTLTFAPGDVTKTITISLGGGIQYENSEHFYVNLSGATGGAVISDWQGVGTIWDDDEEFPCPPQGCNVSGESAPQSEENE